MGTPFPADAQIREHDPLFRADGLGPRKLESKEESSLIMPECVRWIDTFSFSDEGDKVKIYIEFPESLKSAKFEHSFGRFSATFLAHAPSAVVYGFRIKEQDGWILEHERKDGFAHEIVPEECKHRLSSNGQRVTLTLAKKDPKEKWYELSKKSI